MELSRHVTEDLRPRTTIVAIIIVAVLAILWARLAQLQIVEGVRHRAFAEQYGVRELRLPPTRGQILARDGSALVRSEPHYDLVAIPRYLGDPAAVAASLAHVLRRDREAVLAILQPLAGRRDTTPVVIHPDLTPEQLARFLAQRSPWEDPDRPAHPLSGMFLPFTLRGLDVETRPVRNYTDGALAPHILGYLTAIDADELARRQAAYPDLYQSNELVGRGGIEATWDHLLRGRAGFFEQLVDARGVPVTTTAWMRPLEWQRATAGATIRLTLDPALQRAAQRAMTGKQGALVALEPRTGAVLAMVSQPGYDLTPLYGADRNAAWARLQNDTAHPLYHRAIQSAYPPGSTYKMVVAAAALSEGVVTPRETIHCPGGRSAGTRVFGCWRKSGHGAVNLRRALAESCDVYFYTLGERLGPDRLAGYARRFGLGERTGIELPHERSGLIPTSAWKLERHRRLWSLGDTFSASIGQGYDLMTPLQAAMMVATIANGGHRVYPHLTAEIVGDAAAQARWSASRPAPTPVIPPHIVTPIAEGLIGVVHDPGGTAGRLRPLNLKIAGKTGTAQVVGLLRGTSIAAHNDHAWFVAYAPYDAPRIAVAVILEHGGHGGAVAAPVAGEVIRAYLSSVAPPTTNPPPLTKGGRGGFSPPRTDASQ